MGGRQRYVIAALTLMDALFQARRNAVSLRGNSLRAFQNRRAREMIAYALAHSPFYARHYNGKDTRAWRTLPTVDKRLLMAHFGEVNTRCVSLEEAMGVALTAERTRDFRPTLRGLTVGLSSGTSGHRGLFLADRRERARWVGAVLARLLPPFRLRGYSISLFSMSGSNLYNDLRGRWLRFHHHDLSTSLDDAVRSLNREQPDLLCGPPSYLDALSARRVAGDLRIAPRKLVSVAEVLEPHISKALAERFGCPVHQVYQCTEGLVGVSCRLGRLHAQEDLVATQFERLSPDDEAAMPIITDLWHRTLPVIRYQLRDVVTLAASDCACGCGFQVIDQVEGRSDDVCEFTRHDGSTRSVFPASLRRMVLLSTNDITDYDMTQERLSQLRVTIALRTQSDPARAARAVAHALTAGLREQGIDRADLHVTTGDCESPPGKRRRIRRLWAKDLNTSEV
jgi:phenylacetate-CoA ligase